MELSGTSKYMGTYRNPPGTWCKPFLNACGNITKEGYLSNALSEYAY